ncbi:hypothetical protein RRG08_045042 [Elysia crispata]|uniref:Uncharacterized protein n=1 Tax=Elysia crispata TaxID=231223 RepID=A0AAE0XU68_9GAST|nr:hypothetical protein RRG08_045042 [Elysia crispata]
MASHLGCLGFGPGTKRTGVRDACSCEMKTSNKFWLSYTRKATLDISRATVYLLWPGKPDLRSENYTFPEIRDISGLRLIKNVSIGVAIVLFLATVAFLGVLNNNTYGGVEDLYHHAQGRVPSDVRNQMEAAHSCRFCGTVSSCGWAGLEGGRGWGVEEIDWLKCLAIFVKINLNFLVTGKETCSAVKFKECACILDKEAGSGGEGRL